MCPSNPKPLLAPGASGSCVKFLQFFLNVKANAGLAVDGSYGPATTGAVLKYQRAHGLSADGVTGNQTWTYLLTGQTVPVTQFPPAGSSRGGGSGGGGGGSTSGGGSTQTGGGSGNSAPDCYKYASLYANLNNCVSPTSQTPAPTASRRPPPSS
jgi:peptidoglycan hydrolase-like protein with peptidoglycan-binding domain